MRIRPNRFQIVMAVGILVSFIGQALVSSQSSRARSWVFFIGMGVCWAGMLWQLVSTLLDIPPRPPHGRGGPMTSR